MARSTDPYALMMMTVAGELRALSSPQSSMPLMPGIRTSARR
jgi:hypothetical protein